MNEAVLARRAQSCGSVGVSDASDASDALLDFYRVRDAIFGPGLFSHAGWEIFLAISSDSGGVRIGTSERSLSHPPRVVERWVGILVNNGLIRSTSAFEREVYVLTERGTELLELMYFRSASAGAPLSRAKPTSFLKRLGRLLPGRRASPSRAG